MSRDKFTKSSLQVSGFKDRPVRNKFFQGKNSAESLALVFPGLRYSCDKPLLHYTTELLLARGLDVLHLWADYTKPDYQSSSQDDQSQHMLEDAQALLEAGNKAGSYKNLLLAGKSLGTLTMTLLFRENSELHKETSIWFTPLFYLPPVAQAVLNSTGPTFVAGSDTDLTFDPEAVSQIKSKTNITTHVIKDADHSLEIPGDLFGSLRIITQLMNSLTSFIS